MEPEQKSASERPVILTVDIVVTYDQQKVLLIKRRHPPFQDKYCLPGGHVDPDDRSAAHAAARELEEETGIRVSAAELSLLMVLDAPDRDPREDGRRISLVYVVALADGARLVDLQASSDAAHVVMYDLEELKEEQVGFDHYQAIEQLGPAYWYRRY